MGATKKTEINASDLDEEQAPAYARRTLYLLTSAAISDPVEGRISLLFDNSFPEQTGAAYELLNDICSDDVEPGPGEAKPDTWSSGDVERMLDTSGRALREEYIDVFGHTISADCPPYELEYLERTDLFYRSRELSDIAGFYRAFGLRKSEGNRYRADHLCLQAEYMSFLIQKRLHGHREGHGQDKLDICRDAETSFYEEHLSWWLPAFARQLERTTDLDGFYGRFGAFLSRFSVLERDRFGRDPETDLNEPKVMEYDPEDRQCGDCEIPAMKAVTKKSD